VITNLSLPVSERRTECRRSVCVHCGYGDIRKPGIQQLVYKDKYLHIINTFKSVQAIKSNALYSSVGIIRYTICDSVYCYC